MSQAQPIKLEQTGQWPDVAHDCFSPHSYSPVADGKTFPWPTEMETGRKKIMSGTDSLERLAFQRFLELLCRELGRRTGQGTEVSTHRWGDYRQLFWYIYGFLGYHRLFKTHIIIGRVGKLNPTEEARSIWSKAWKEGKTKRTHPETSVAGVPEGEGVFGN